MILIVNTGSSSLKVALFRRHPRLEAIVTASIDRLDGQGGSWIIHSDDRSEPEKGSQTLAGHADAQVRADLVRAGGLRLPD